VVKPVAIRKVFDKGSDLKVPNLCCREIILPGQLCCADEAVSVIRARLQPDSRAKKFVFSPDYLDMSFFPLQLLIVSSLKQLNNGRAVKFSNRSYRAHRKLCQRSSRPERPCAVQPQANSAVHSRLYRLGRDHALVWSVKNGKVATLKHVIVASKTKAAVSTLLFACKQPHTNIVAELLRLDDLREATINFPEGRRGNSPIYHACAEGHIETVNLLMALPGNNHLRHSGSHDDTPLHGAASNGHVDIMRLLLDSGIDINAYRKDGKTALHIAMHNDHADAFDLLLERGANVDAATFGAARPIVFTMIHGKSDYFLKLVENGSDANGNENPRLLQMAVDSGTNEMVRLLLEHGVDPNARTEDGDTALQSAIHSRSRYICELLFKYGARVPEAPSRPWWSPIRRACERGCGDLLQYLYDLDPEKHQMQESRKALLHSCHGPEAVQFLLDRGHEVDELDANGETALTRLICEMTPMSFSKSSIYAATNLLVENRADVSVGLRGGQSLLFAAITESRDAKLAELLIRAGANLQNPRGRENNDTLLHYLSEIPGPGAATLAELLIARGLDVSAIGNDGSPAIVKACEVRNPHLLRVLIAQGADIKYHDTKRGNLLHIVVCHTPFASTILVRQCITVLVSAGVTLNGPIHNGLTPFQTAIVGRHYVDAMLQNGGDVNMPAIYGQRMYNEEQINHEEFPLLHAFLLLNYEEDDVRWLLEHGANIKAVDCRGRTALHVAAYHSRNQRFVDLLLDFGADPKAKDYGGNEAGRIIHTTKSFA
jgi:ankyrin repeat protein